MTYAPSTSGVVGDMQIKDAQADLRRAYVGGGPGALISGLVWLGATAVSASHSAGAGFASLFFGGMVIYPTSTLICRVGFGRAGESSQNPFGRTVLESTVAMIAGLFTASLFLSSRPLLAFPVSALAVGGHYFIFTSVYGDRTFWLLGALLTAIGLGDILLPPLRGTSGLFVAIVELSFGVVITLRNTSLGDA